LIEIYFKNFILQILAYVEKLQSNEKKNWRYFCSKSRNLLSRFFSNLKQNNKKSKGVVIPFLIQMWNLNK
jgi:hypothetical protein